ncbi:MAG: precorrin-4 C(11)-methyltransferase [Thermodesulfobacteriota bacterium]
MTEDRVQVYFVGAGPGDPELITVRGRQVIREADLVLYAGSLVPPEIVACGRPDARVVDSSSMTLKETHSLICDAVRAGGLVARVHTGDPSLYGAMREQMALLERDGIACRVIPGVTSAFAAAAAAGVSFTLPEKTQSLILTRMAGRTPVPDREQLKEMARHRASMAVYLSAGDPERLVSELRLGGYPGRTPVIAAYRVGWPEERIVRATLDTLSEIVAREKITRQAIFLVLPGQDDETAFSRLYSPDFHHGFRKKNGRSPREAKTPPDETAVQDRKSGTAVYGLTPQGARTAATLARALKGDLFLPEALALRHRALPFRALLETVAQTFDRYESHVFVAAAGIVVRAVAPLIRSKDLDPAVVVLDSEGRFAVSLLSGHMGGANRLALEVARLTGGEPVITTATDTAGLTGWDLLAADRDMAIANPEAVKTFNMALLSKEPVSVLDPENRLGLKSAPETGATEAARAAGTSVSEARLSVIVTWESIPEAAFTDSLVLHPRCLVAGVGCNLGTSSREILDLIESTFLRHGLSPASLSSLATIEAKQNEPGILEAAESLGVVATFYPADALRYVPVPNPSGTVKRHMGVESVCEAAALKRAGGGRLLVPKTLSRNATLAIALEGSSSSASAPETPTTWPPQPFGH